MEITAPGNKSRSRNPSRGKRGKRERERGEEKERKVSQRRRIEKRGYIIYIRVLKDCTRMAGLPRKMTATAAPRDSTCLIVAKTTFVLYRRQTKDRQRTDRKSWNLPLLLRDCVAPAIVMQVDELDKPPRSMQRPSHRSNKVCVPLKSSFIYISIKEIMF